MSEQFTGRKETLDWVGEKAKIVWEAAGGRGVFAANFERRKHCYAAQIKVGGGQTKSVSIYCTGAKNMRDLEAKIEIPPEIERVWKEKRVDLSDKALRVRRSSDGVRWCLYLTGDDRIRTWARNIGGASKYLEGDAVPMGARETPLLSKADADELRELNQQYANANAERKPRIVKGVERGNVGKAMKKHRNHKCQICEAMGMNPMGFMTERGIPYTEAHHVEGVGKGGGLGPENIVVLCANHHRQMHSGNVALVRKDIGEFEFRIDETTVKVARYSP